MTAEYTATDLLVRLHALAVTPPSVTPPSRWEPYRAALLEAAVEVEILEGLREYVGRKRGEVRE